MSNPERYPDIEIYALDITFKQIGDWLKTRFSEVEQTQLVKKKSEARATWKADGMIVTVFGNAVGAFSSIWFQTNATPWDTDLECAQTASHELNTEIRCSNSGWSEGQRPDTKWWQILPNQQEALIDWQEQQ
ncbi:hypothetical protein HF888_05005 [Bermanella marisrubri]|uniref:Uncharacterized protein n=1 Tax=Bermanella marisrubri TaxID=207949 RepID=Q1N1Y9_9GAMM|nr:hypothetical protein [Bermanella marisrubri]EAT12142.1 hypothetical protein RED65_03930 [Oceanobacter sp. RED65] [Bermanella marisrubri]QIZ83619.1 hypothetical protein HF888_05005 [Bermanella marisrubri]